MRDANPDAEESRNFVFTVTTPTLPLTTPQYLLKLIQNHTNYQVIPAPLMLNYDADEMVVAALPLSKYKLIDITLPLTITDSSGNELNYLGRYLLHDQRLVGIRLCSSKKEEFYANNDFKKWRFGRTIKYRIGKCISDYYKKQRFSEESYSNDIPIGDFTLTVGDLKLCLLFESEIEDNEATLIEYKRQGCEVFSVVCDVPRDKAFEATMNITNAKLSTKNENMFRRFIRQNNRLMIYAGARMATTDTLFLANSFIIHPQLPEKCIQPFFFNDGVSLSVLCNVELFKRPGARKEKYNESKVKPELYIDANLLSINTRPGKSIKFYANGQIQQTLFSKSHGDLLKKMKIWLIYQIDNHKNPFIFSVPLSEKMQEVASQLEKISQYLSKPLPSFLILYKKSKAIIANEEFEQSLGVPIYEDFDELCTKCGYNQLNIYTDDRGHYQLLASRIDGNKRVRLHYDYIKLHGENGENKVQAQRINKMNDFATSVIRKRIVGYQKLLIESRSEEWRLNKEEQIDAIAIYLKSKLRSQVNNHPFYKNILDRSTEEIRSAMIEAEYKLFNSQTSMIEENPTDNPLIEQEASVESDEKDFWNKIKEMKRTQSKQQKRLNIKCHKCHCFNDKSLYYRCPTCRTEVCFVCMMDKEKEVKNKKEFIDSLKCLICRKLCNCAECLNKDKPEESREIPLLFQSFERSNPSQLLVNQQQEKEAIQYRDYCTVCLINERKSTKIKVSCSTCDREECLACIRSERKNTTVTLEWQCSICKPYVPPPPEPMIEEDKGMQVEEPAGRKFSKSKSGSRSRSKSPPKKNQFVPRQNYNNHRQNNNGNFKGNWNQNRQNNSNNNFNKGNNKMVDEREERSVSRSKSPVRRPMNKKPSQEKKSASRSASPKRNTQNNKKNEVQNKSRSCSRSKSPPRVRKPPVQAAQKRKSASRSRSPVRNTQKPKQKSPARSASKSKSPVRVRNDKANQRKKSNSRSPSPARNKPAQKKKSASRSASKSKSPPRKTAAAESKKRSVSRSGSPQKDCRSAKKSVSRSRSGSRKSRERSRDDNKTRNSNYNNNGRSNQAQPEKLWNNDKSREGKWGNNNNDGSGNYNNNSNYNNNYNRDRNQGENNRGGYRGRGRGGYQGNYNRDRNNQGDDGNNGNRRYNNYNSNNNSSYNSNYSRDNNRDSNRDSNQNNSRNNNSGDNENNQLLSVGNFEVNNDVDY